jgi:hypothetical protein
LINFEYDRPPTYFIYGGFVFCPLTINYFTCWGEKWDSESPSELLFFFSQNWKQKDTSQIVVLNKVLPTDSNIGYHEIEDEIVDFVNGKKVDDISDLFAALQHVDNNKYAELILKSKKCIVIDKDKAKRENQELMQLYGVDKSGSDDLLEGNS